MDNIAFTRDEHSNRSNMQINWTRMQILDGFSTIANLYDRGNHYDVDYTGEGGTERIYKRNGYPKEGGYLEWCNSDGSVKSIIYRGAGNNMIVDGYGASDGGGLDGDSDAIFGSDGYIEGGGSFFGEDDFTEGYSDLKITANGNNMQEASQKTISFEPKDQTRNALSIFTKVMRTVNSDYPRGKAEKVTSLKDISQSLSNLKDRVKPNPKDKTQNASRYDEYLDVNTDITADMDAFLNDMIKIPVSFRVKEIIDFENIKDKGMSNLSIINSWLNCLVNKTYLEHCIKNDEPLPAERISIPEHFVNEIYISETHEELMDKIDKVLNAYVDEDGRVYHNSYAKYLRNVKGMVDLAQRDSKSFEELFPRYEGSFRYNIIHPKSRFFSKDTAEQKTQKNNAVNLTIIQDIAKDTIPDTYMDKLEQEDKNIIPDSVETELVDYMLPLATEVTHLNPTVNQISADFIFENMKGISVIQDEVNKDASDAEKILSWSYQNALDDGAFKRYIDYSTLLPGIFELLLNNINEDYNKEEMYKMITKNPNGKSTIQKYGAVNKNLRVIMAKRLKELYLSHPDMACILLAFMNEDL